MGAQGDDVFNAALGGSSANLPTLNTFDTLNGGNGTNTLQIEGGQNLTGTITNMQTVVYGGDVTGLTGDSINTNLVGGLTTVGLQNTIIEDSANGSSGGLAINGLNDSATVRVTGAIASDSTGYVKLVNTYDVGATTANLMFSNANSSGVGKIIIVETAGTTTNTLKTLTVSGNTQFTSASNFTVALLDDGSVNGITTLNVNAAIGGTLALAVGGSSYIGATLTTINVSGSTGNTIIDNTGTSTDLTYTGGAGDDILYFDLGSIDSNDVITAGAGTDSLRLDLTSVTGSNFSVSSNVATISNQGYALINATGFEQAGFNGKDQTITSIALDMSKLTASSVRSEATASITRALDTDMFVAAQDVTFTIAHERSAIGPNYAYVGSGIVNVSAESGKTVTITGVANNGSGAPASGQSDFAKLVLTGAGNVTFNNDVGSTNVSTAGGATVDASGLTTGSLVWTGNDVQTDYVTLGSGADTAYITGSSNTLYDRVTGFGTTDNVTLSTALGTGDWKGLVTIDSGVTTVSGAISNALTQLAPTEVGYFIFGGNTYVVENGASADFAIQLVGTFTLDAATANSVSTVFIA